MNEILAVLRDPWIVVGVAGQVAFTARFLVQWIVSERRKESVIPVVFWFLSMMGSLFLLTYSIVRKEPVFILGQSVGMVVYLRNLVLIRRARASAA